MLPHWIDSNLRKQISTRSLACNNQLIEYNGNGEVANVGLTLKCVLMSLRQRVATFRGHGFTTTAVLFIQDNMQHYLRLLLVDSQIMQSSGPPRITVWSHCICRPRTIATDSLENKRNAFTTMSWSQMATGQKPDETGHVCECMIAWFWSCRRDHPSSNC
jgi:hypothetical protein